MSNDLISRSELLRVLQYNNSKFEGKGVVSSTVAMMIDTLIKYVEEMPAADNWIPITEEYPAEKEMVLVTCMTKKGVRNVNRAYCADGFWHGSGSMSGVVAWQPMPEPWKGGVSDE